MGAGIPLIFIILVVAVLGVAALLAATRSLASKEHVVAHRSHGDLAVSLDQEVRPGQDPAVVVAALEREGYHALTDGRDPRLVHVDCPAGADRERPHVRAVIGDTRTSAIDAGVPMDPGGVRFRDEQ